MNVIINNSLSIIASLSRGYKTSGINQSPNFSNYRIYKTEYANNIDIGFTYSSENYDILLNSFYMYRDNPQLRLFVQFDVENPSSFDYATFNTKYGYNCGIESTIKYYINDNISAYADIGYLITYISEYTFLEQNYGNRELAHSPKYSGNIGYKITVCDFFM